MVGINYNASAPEYFWHKPHFNFFNKIIHGKTYKALNPIRDRTDFDPNGFTAMPTYLNGQVPQLTWLYGNLDYANDKYHKHYQSHDDWYPDRKNKTLGDRNGGMRDSLKQNSKYMVIKHEKIPRGC